MVTNQKSHGPSDEQLTLDPFPAPLSPLFKSFEMSQSIASFRRTALATFGWIAFAIPIVILPTDAAAQTKPRTPKGAAAAAAPTFNQSTVQFDTVIEFKGKLKDSQRNLMVVTREDGTDVTVKLHDDPTRLRFVADAKLAYLRPQMMARTTVNLGPAGAPVSPADLIELFQPLPPEALAGVAKESFTPGVYSASHEKPNPQLGFVPGNYQVVGMIVGMDNKGIYLNTGRGPMPIPLSPEAKIGLVYHNLSLAQQGDPVTVTGFHQPPDETQVLANSVTIRPDRVYGEAEENPRRRTTRTRTKNKPEEPAAVAEAAAPQPE